MIIFRKSASVRHNLRSVVLLGFNGVDVDDVGVFEVVSSLRGHDDRFGIMVDSDLFNRLTEVQAPLLN